MSFLPEGQQNHYNAVSSMYIHTAQNSIIVARMNPKPPLDTEISQAISNRKDPERAQASILR